MAKKPNKTAAIGEFARLHGVTPKTVREWRKAGHVVPSVGPIDVEKSNARLAQRPAQFRGGSVKGPHAPETPTAGETLADAKRVKATFEALLAEHRRDRLVDSLAPVEPAIAAVAEDLAVTRARLREVPAWVAPRLVDVGTAPMAVAIISKTISGALHDVSRDENEPAWDSDIEDRLIPIKEGKLTHVDCDGVCHYVRRYVDDTSPTEPKTKRKRRRRSSPAIEAAIAEAGAEGEVDSDLIVAIERAVPTMSLTEARTRREVAEGGLKRAQFDLLKKRVVRVERVQAALTANLNGVRTNLLGIASKTAPRVALLSNAQDIEGEISKELEQVLSDIAEPRTLIEGCMSDE